MKLCMYIKSNGPLLIIRKNLPCPPLPQKNPTESPHSDWPLSPCYTAPDGTRIQTCSTVTDLSVQMCDDARFDEQIIGMVRKARKQVGWMLRVFEMRDSNTMLTLYKALVLPLLEYCCQLWSLRRIGLIRKTEEIQINFPYHI